MLGEILDLFDGQTIESTGDGNYSIFLKEKINIKIIHKLGNNFMDIDLNFYALKEYMHNFSSNEISDFRHIIRCVYCRNKISESEYMRLLFFTIFATFNIEVNKYLERQIKNSFLTRVGCMQGNCKISRINIPNHILQDKLIGSIVHKAAHQSYGKI